jgi:hypothetical protein
MKDVIEFVEQAARQRHLADDAALAALQGRDIRGAPLSISIAAGVSARISEIRPPLKLKTRQKSCISKGARRDALMKSRRSEALRYFRLPVEPVEAHSGLGMLAHRCLA